MISAGAGDDICVSGIDEVAIRGRQTGAEMVVLCSCIDKGGTLQLQGRSHSSE